MKVLFLNPHVNADHPVVKGLQAKGLAVLLPGNAQEAWQLLSLHGSSLDLVITHREESPQGNEDGGLKFVSRLKASPSYSDLPVIVTSHRWGDAENARHQQSSDGANAYLKWPFDAAALYSLIQAVFGGSVPGAEAVSSPSIPTASGTSASNELVLEDASSVFGRGAGNAESRESGIRLEMPESEPQLDSRPLSDTPSVVVPHASTALEIELPGTNDAMVQVLAQNEPVLHAPPARPSSRGTPEPADLSDPESDSDAARDLPYLFKKEGASAAFALPLGDAVVPGGAAQTPDAETLKKYLLLREQDVAVLSTQLKAAKDQVKALEDQLREERGRGSELDHVTGEQKHRIDEMEREKQQALTALQAELGEMRFQLKAKTDKARLLETQVHDTADEMERIKDRVRSDIRKIRVRERELENRLEILKKDSEALIAARESKIIELKRKLDLIEFNMDLLQDQHAREKENAAKLRDRLAKAAQVVRVAGGLLDNPAGASQLAAALASDEPPGSENAA